MHNLKILLLIIFCFGSFSVFAQKTLYLKPFIGIQEPFCHYDRKAGKLDAFKINYVNITDNFGLLMELPLNEDWTITGGLSKGNLGWGYRIKMPDEISNDPNGISPQHNSSTAIYIYRFPVLAKRNLNEVVFLELDPDRDLYLFNFKLYAQAGLSFDMLDPLSDFEDFGLLSGGNYDFFRIHENITILNRRSISVIAGIGTQFYHKGKPRFDLNLFYSQGIRDMLAIDVNYQMNNVKGHTRLLTRGSVLGLTLGYPIRLKTFRAKTET